MVPWNFNMQNLNIFYVYYGEDERRPNKKKPFSTSNGFPYSSENYQFSLFLVPAHYKQTTTIDFK